MTTISFKEIRIAAVVVKAKINRGETITSEELDIMRENAAMNGNTVAIAEYATAKRYLMAEKEGVLE
ncbi:hypothetical protein ABEW00_05030 [Rossellomorea vietnamensis]|uniref:hypothetical protein n=1 Tax=Rossellomorea vietnamensis TaxID=218284 RepID=UPI003D2A5EF7